MAAKLATDPNIRPLTEALLAKTAMLYHDVWHQTQAPLQELEVAKSRDLGFFKNRLLQWLETTHVLSQREMISGLISWEGSILKALFVAPRSQGLGFGSRLLAIAEHQMNGAELQLDCVCGNYKARCFYELHGWQIAPQPLATEHPAKAATWRMVKRR